MHVDSQLAQFGNLFLERSILGTNLQLKLPTLSFEKNKLRAAPEMRTVGWKSNVSSQCVNNAFKPPLKMH